jgi:hypothetical protein
MGQKTAKNDHFLDPFFSPNPVWPKGLNPGVRMCRSGPDRPKRLRTPKKGVKNSEKGVKNGYFGPFGPKNGLLQTVWSKRAKKTHK